MRTERIPDGTEVYWDGRHYDLDSKSYPDDLGFYLGEARKAKGPVLELACGTGRLAIPLAKAGIDVTGLDVSAPMLAQAKLKSEKLGVNIRWIKSDCRSFNLKRRFRLIYIAFNSMQHLHDRGSLEKMFAAVKKHLSPGGRFIVDVFNPDPRYLTRDPGEELPVGFYPDPDTGKEVAVMETYFYDRAAQSSRITWHYRAGGKNVRSRKLNMRCFYPRELDMLLHYNGFGILRKYGDFNGKRFHAGSGKQIVICRKS